VTPSITPTITPSTTLSNSVTPSITPTVTPSTTLSNSVTPSITPTQTPSTTLSNSVTPSVTPTVTPSTTLSNSVTPSVTPTVTPSTTLSNSVTPSVTPTVTPSNSITPSVTITPSLTPTPSPSSCPLTICYLATTDSEATIYQCSSTSTATYDNRPYWIIYDSNCTTILGYLWWNTTDWTYSSNLGGGTVYSTLDGYYCPISDTDWSISGSSSIYIKFTFSGICPSPSATPSVTPTVTITPSLTPSTTLSNSVTPSVTPTVTTTPSLTPSITPSITPSVQFSTNCYEQTIQNDSLSQTLTGEYLDCYSNIGLFSISGGNSENIGCAIVGSIVFTQGTGTISLGNQCFSV